MSAMSRRKTTVGAICSQHDGRNGVVVIFLNLGRSTEFHHAMSRVFPPLPPTNVHRLTDNSLLVNRATGEAGKDYVFHWQGCSLQEMSFDDTRRQILVLGPRENAKNNVVPSASICWWFSSGKFQIWQDTLTKQSNPLGGVKTVGCPKLNAAGTFIINALHLFEYFLW